MRLIFSGGQAYDLAPVDEPWRERGAYLLCCVSGDLRELLAVARGDTPDRITDESGETVLDLTEYHCVTQISYSLEDEIITLLLRHPTDGELMGQAADAAMRAGVNGSPAEPDEPRLLAAMRAYGRARASVLADKASTLTDTELIAEEDYIPEWQPGPWAAGAPVQHNGQVYRVLQAHDSTGNESWAPDQVPALFGLCHTTDPTKAKPWVQPLGISGAYKLGECYRDEQGRVWRQVFDGDNVYDAVTVPGRWEQVEV